MKRFMLLAIAAFVVTGLSCKAAGESTAKKDDGKKADVKKDATASTGGVVSAGEVTFTFTPGDDEEPEQVFLAGDFNGWAANDPNYQMEAKDGKFSATIELDPGTYKFKLVIDGQWVGSMEDHEGRFTPAVGTYVDDGFGGKNAVLTVEE